LVTSPSQLPKPALHTIPHTPPVHERVPPAELQTLPQDPQLFTSELVLISQPSPALLLQFWKPELHAIEQAPLRQVGVPLTVLHGVEQELQCSASVLRLDSQPLAALLSQLPKPALHTMLHVLAAQVGVPLTVLHGVVQEPQCKASVVSVVSHPLETSASQLPKPPVHEIEHCPELQAGAPWLFEQASPHPPQCSSAVLMFVSQPFALLPSQSPMPDAQVMPHTPALQAGVPPLDEQAVVQVPQ